MSNPNFPDPDKIPDMSLGERTDKPAPIQPLPPLPPASYESKAVPIPPAPAYESPTWHEPPQWRRGDSVLAPWEPAFLYPGVIRDITHDGARGDQALISYDDGGEGWVFLFSLHPFELKIGQPIEARSGSGTQYDPGEIVKMHRDEVLVRWDDGAEEWILQSMIRVPCVANSPGAIGTKSAPWLDPFGPSAPQSSGIPSWGWSTVLIMLILALRCGCQAMR
jgi:hypothetical protein